MEATISSQAPETRRIKLLILDDHPLVRRGLMAAAEDSSDCEVVGEAAHSAGIVGQVTRLAPDVVVLDIRLGTGVSGIEIARMLRKRFAAMKILVLSNYDSEPYVRELREIGIDGYLLKSATPSAVLDAVRTVFEGETVFDPNVLARFARPSGVTSREAEILQLAAEGLGNQEIAYRLNMSVTSVQVSLASAFAKLGVHNRTAAVVQAARLGVIVIDD